MSFVRSPKTESDPVSSGRDGDRALAVRAGDAFLREVPRVHVPAAMGTLPDEMLLLHRLFEDELVGRAVDRSFHKAFVEGLAEQLFRLVARLADPLRHEVHL